jgi:recombination associated protein RdgC
MWFKNLQVYQFDKDYAIDEATITEALETATFKPCAKILPMSIGWVPPIGVSKDGALLHQANGLMLVCLQIEEKILPSTVIRDKVNDRVIELEEEQQRKLSSKEKLNLKDDVYSTLLPQAFSKKSKTYAFINIKSRQLFIDCASKTRAETFITFMRKTLGSLPVSLLEMASPSLKMSEWLKSKNVPESFHIGEHCTLNDSKFDGSSVRCSKQDLLSPNVHAFVKDGMNVTQLQLQWKEHLSFVLKDDFSITQIKYTDAVQALADDIHTETPEQKQDADFFIMSQTINEFMSEFMPLFKKTA